MILTGPAIRDAISRGDIAIDPLQPGAIQPNGIDYHLDKTLIPLEDKTFDPRHPPQGTPLEMTDEGFVLEPGTLYLGLTQETVASEKYAQWIFGDRSVGNLGLFTQVCAPLGHTGSKIRWTLELVVVQPVRIYPGMKMGKICFLENVGDIAPYGDPRFHGGKYLANNISLSRLSQEHSDPT